MPTDRIKKASDKNWKNFRFYECDVTNYKQIFSIIAANDKIDSVVHLAATGSIPLSFDQPQLTMQNNVIGFVNVLNLVRALNVNSFIYASSSSVYGHSAINPRKEETIGKVSSPYALSKIMNEQMAELFSSPYKSFYGLRFFNVYGPGQNFNSPYCSAIPKFINEEKPRVNGDGETTRDFTFVDDVSLAIELCLSHKKPCNEVLNIGTGKRTSLNQVLDFIGKRSEATYMQARHGDVQTSYADISLAEKVIGYKPKFSLEQGLSITKSYYDSLK
jgi:UDP-N-acetylglucosamine 4-epimerase